jgi:outer membrane protein TolC
LRAGWLLLDVNVGAGDDTVTGVRLRVVALAPLLVGVLLSWAAPAVAQSPLTLDEAITRASSDTPDGRALSSTINEAEARIQGAQSGYWPRVDVTESV